MKIFKDYDVIVGPTAPTTAFNIGEQVDDPLTMYANDILTIPVNLAGVPSISIPCGKSNGRPIGLQIVGKPFDEKHYTKLLINMKHNLTYMMTIKHYKESESNAF